MKKIGVYCKSKKKGSPLGVPDGNFNIKSKRKIGSGSARTCSPEPLLAHGCSVVLVHEIRLGAENEGLCVAVGSGVRHNSLNDASATPWPGNLGNVIYLSVSYSSHREVTEMGQTGSRE